MTAPSVSVVIAARDAAATLDRAIHSMLAQSLRPAEILLVLNGCGDATPEIARALAAAAPTIRILESPAAEGVAGAARLGCAEARHPLIARMDADDWSHPDRLRAQVRTHLETAAGLVTCRVVSTDSLGPGIERYVEWANSLRVPDDFRRERFIESPVIQPGALMTRAAYLAAGGYFPENGPEDYDLWLRMLGADTRFIQAPAALLHWRDSPQRLTRTHSDYDKQTMAATKARHLARIPAIHHHGAVIAGAGPQGRRLNRLLAAEGVTVHALFDLDPKKIGRSHLGVPILDSATICEVHPDPVLLGCVGHAGREKVRQLAVTAGRCEGRNFFPCC